MVATPAECEQALRDLAVRMAQTDNADGFDRTLSCTLRDLQIVFRGRLEHGTITGIEQTSSTDAQIRLEVSSDDLVALVNGSLNAGSAWAGGRLKIRAGVRDMLRLRSIF